MTFLKNIWYVAAWSHELGAAEPLGVTIIGEPIALFRRTDGTVVAFEDRCPHRQAPLSLGRIEGDALRCMYHGLRFDCDGVCVEVPGSSAIPPRTQVRSVPSDGARGLDLGVAGRPGARGRGRSSRTRFGLDDPEWLMRASGIDYEADYQLVNDNLCDLSHLDFVHERTLGASTGAKWSAEQPKVTPIDDGLLFERWFRDHPLMPGRFDQRRHLEQLPVPAARHLPDVHAVVSGRHRRGERHRRADREADLPAHRPAGRDTDR